MKRELSSFAAAPEPLPVEFLLGASSLGLLLLKVAVSGAGRSPGQP